MRNSRLHTLRKQYLGCRMVVELRAFMSSFSSLPGQFRLFDRSKR